MPSPARSEARVYWRHVRPFFCAAGAQRVAERYGIDFLDFLQNGYPVELAEKIDNPLMRKVVDSAVRDWERQNGKE